MLWARGGLLALFSLDRMPPLRRSTRNLIIYVRQGQVLPDPVQLKLAGFLHTPTTGQHSRGLTQGA